MNDCDDDNNDAHGEGDYGDDDEHGSCDDDDNDDNGEGDDDGHAGSHDEVSYKWAELIVWGLGVRKGSSIT